MSNLQNQGASNIYNAHTSMMRSNISSVGGKAGNWGADQRNEEQDSFQVSMLKSPDNIHVDKEGQQVSIYPTDFMNENQRIDYNIQSNDSDLNF